MNFKEHSQFLTESLETKAITTLPASIATYSGTDPGFWLGGAILKIIHTDYYCPTVGLSSTTIMI